VATSPEVKKYFTTNSEIEAHMIGSYVGVCWNIKEVEENRINLEGHRIKVITSLRVGKPYISFPWIDDDSYERSDSTVGGGLSLEQAEQVLKELQWACGYIKEVQ
jgi:hypothetical protein